MGMPKREPIKDVMAELKLLGHLEPFLEAITRFKADPFLMTERSAAYEARRLYPGPNASVVRQKKAIELRVILAENPSQYPMLHQNRRSSTFWADSKERLKNRHKTIKRQKQAGVHSQAELERQELNQQIEAELQQLAERNPVKNLQRDMDWCYQSMARRGLMPLASGCPSVAAYDLYRHASDPENKADFIRKYLDFEHKREKADGGGSQEVEEDRRKSFSALRKLAGMVVFNIESSVKDCVRQSPEDVARVLRSIGWTVEMAQ